MQANIIGVIFFYFGYAGFTGFTFNVLRRRNPYIQKYQTRKWTHSSENSILMTIFITIKRFRGDQGKNRYLHVLFLVSVVLRGYQTARSFE